MIGIVNAARRPLVTLQIEASVGIWRGIEFVVDSGFTDYLTLPQSLIDEFALLPYGQSDIILADGSWRQSRSYIGKIKWNDVERITVCGFP